MLALYPSRRMIVRIAVGLALAGLAACASSPPSRFYTLSAGGEAATASHAASPALLIDMQSVSVPVSVARSQLVVQETPTQVKVLEEERWVSSPDDEIRNALSAMVTQQLGGVDVHGVAHADDVPVYRIAVDVQRFESWPGSHALIDAVWSVRSTRRQETLTCRSVVRETVTGGYDAIVDGHRRALGTIATQIVEGVRALSAKPIEHSGAGPDTAGLAAASTVPCPWQGTVETANAITTFSSRAH